MQFLGLKAACLVAIKLLIYCHQCRCFSFNIAVAATLTMIILAGISGANLIPHTASCIPSHLTKKYLLV